MADIIIEIPGWAAVTVSALFLLSSVLDLWAAVLRRRVERMREVANG